MQRYPLLYLAMGLSLTLAAGGCGGSADAPATPAPATTAAAADMIADRPADGLRRFAYHAVKMGSDYNLVLYAPDQSAADAAARAAEAEIDRLNAVFSDYDAESELSRLSRRTREGPMTEPVAISPDLYRVLALSQAVARQTDGAFDVTVGPYVQLWRRSRRQQELPGPERLAEAKKSVGWQSLVLSPPPTADTGLGGEGVGAANGATSRPVAYTALLRSANMRLDLGGIATGYISDRVLDVLRARGIRSAICDLSGDLAIGDPPPGKTGWKIAIQSLTAPTEIAEYLELANCGVSTSGDTYRYVEIDGVRYSHIVDPATGLGLKHRIGVTVVAPDGVTADVLATTVSILGAEKGLALVEAQKLVKVGLRIVAEQAGKFQTTQSPLYRTLKRLE